MTDSPITKWTGSAVSYTVEDLRRAARGPDLLAEKYAAERTNLAHHRAIRKRDPEVYDRNRRGLLGLFGYHGPWS